MAAWVRISFKYENISAYELDKIDSKLMVNYDKGKTSLQDRQSQEICKECQNTQKP